MAPSQEGLYDPGSAARCLNTPTPPTSSNIVTLGGELLRASLPAFGKPSAPTRPEQNRGEGLSLPGCRATRTPPHPHALTLPLTPASSSSGHARSAGF